MENSDTHGSLVISSGGVDLTLLSRNSGISGDHLGHDTSQSFNTKGKRSDVQQQQVLDISHQDTTLNGGTHSDGFIRVDTFVRCFVEELLDSGLNLGHSAHASDQDDFVDLIFGESRILKTGFTRLDGLVHESVNQTFQLGTGQGQVAVLGAGSVGSEERKIDISLLGGR